MRTASSHATACRCAAAAVLTILAGVIASPGAAAATSAATVDVTPHVGLVDGQTLHVTISGFDPGGKVWLSECATAADVNAYSCGEQLAAQPFLFVVSATASARPYSTAHLLPCAACVLVAVEGVFAGHPPLPVASTGLSFAALPMTGFPLTAAWTAGCIAVVIGLHLVVRAGSRGHPRVQKPSRGQSDHA